MTKNNMNIEMLKRAVLEKKLKEQLKKHGDRQLHLPIREVDRHRPLPLSFAQQRLWFLGQFDSAASLAYHIPVALRLSGKLNPQALTSALDSLVARQESLRTHFTLVDGQPCQQIAPADIGFSLTCLDLRSLSETARTDRVAELAEYEARAPFDFTQGPLIRGQLLQLADEEHVLLLTQHHIISDGWSIGIMVRELTTLYHAALNGHNALLPPLPIQYADYADWQRRELQGDNLTKQRDFWCNQLQGAPALLELPTDRPRPSVQSYVGSQVPIHLSTDILASLKALSQRQDTTLFMTLLTAWAVVLARLSGQDDIVIGTPVANRTRRELEGLIGFFANTLALRVQPSQCNTLSELLRQVRERTIAAYAHQDLPFEQVVEALQPARSLSYNPIFQVMLALNNVPEKEMKLPDLEVSLIEQPQRSAQFDLSLSLVETTSGLVGKLEYATDLFDQDTVIRIAGYLENVLTAMIADVKQAISSLPMMSATECRQVLVNFNAPQTDFPQEALIHELFEQQVALTPDAIAVVFEGKSLSYGELNRRANQLAHHLLAMGVQPNDRVAICVERSLEMIVGLLGILKTGAAYLPLDPAYPAERLTYMLNDAAPVALLTQTTQVEILGSQLPTVVLDANSSSVFDKELDSNPDCRAQGVTSRHLAYVIYTSGSTGQPKGVMVEHANVIRLLAATQNDFRFDRNDVWTLFHSFAFDFSVWEIWGALSYGGKLVIVPAACARSPQEFYALLCHESVTVLNQTPSAFRQLISAQDDTVHSLRCIIFGGEALELPMLAHWIANNPLPQTRLVNMYGITEITVHATYRELTEEDITEGRGSLIGQPLPDLRAYLLDHHAQPVPIGVTGELYIGGAGVARGYLNRPELTAERFIVDPFSNTPDARLYKTGDLGRWLPDGSIEYLGRNDFQVKLRGFRIELGEIEARLVQCAGVREAVVIAREDIPGDTRLVAYLRPQPGVELVPVELRQQLAPHLAEYMLPSAFVMLEIFPLTPNGKLDRKALPAPDRSSVVTRDYVAPIGERETTLVQIWQDLLGLERVSRHDHFFELGGHSLLVVSVIERLRHVGWELDVRTVFTAPVLADLAQAMQTYQGEPAFIVPPNRIPEGCTALTPDMLPLVALSQTEIDTIINAVPGGVANVQDIYPLAPLQEGILFHHLLEPAKDPYIISSLLSIENQTDLEVFTAALQAVIDRHDILRTAIHWNELSQPVQVVHRHAPLSVHYLTVEDGSDVVASLQARMTLSHSSMDLSQAPLIHLQIAADPGSSKLYVLLQFHHIIDDNLSLRNFLTETAAFLTGKGGDLPPSVPYRNFVAYTRQKDNIQAAETFFREYLADFDEVTAPFGLINVQEGGEHITEARQCLTATFSRTIRETARRLGTSPAALFHAGWALVVARTSGCDDVVFGTTLSGRMSGMAGSPSALGMFINTLPVRLKLNGISVEELVRTANDTCANLLRYEQTPLSLVQRYSGFGNMPLFSSLLNCRHMSDINADSPNLEQFGVTSLGGRERTNYPVGISIDDDGDSFVLSAQTINTVDPVRVNAYLVSALEQLILLLADTPNTPVLSVDILPASERQQLLVGFNATEKNAPQTALIHELFEQQAACTPDATAVVFEKRTLSYVELNHRANQLAHHLLALGVQPDDRVAICVERSPEMIVGLLGILKAGAAYVPLDPAYPAERLTYMLDDATPVVLLTQTSLVQTLSGDRPTVLLDAPVFDACATSNPDARALGLASHHLAYVIYTSGSTGQPKGVMVEHRGLYNLIQAQIEAFHITTNTRLLQFASFSFDACISEIATTLCQGACLVLASREALLPGESLINTLKTQAITHVTLPPVAASTLRPDAELPDLTILVLAGEICPPSLVKRWATGRRIINAYGPTEGTVCATFYPCDAQDERVPPIGRPIANTQIYILDTQGQPVPLGVAGEIHIGGVGVARGYLNRPELTAERFIPDPFSAVSGARLYKTGDIGRWLPDGNIEYLGRNDFQVKLRGFRIELGEIEARLTQCPGVREAIVIAREDTPDDKRLVAYMLAQPDIELVPAELRQQLAQHLAEYMLPGAFVTLETFPLTPNGKLDRKALPAPEKSAVATRGYEAPKGELEIALAQIWQDLLGLERIGRYDHFFELGGHSLMVVSLIERLRRQGQALDARAVFSAPILSDMAQIIQTYQGESVFTVPPNRIPEGCTELTPDLLPLVALSQTEIDTIVKTVAGGVANVQDIYPLSPLQEGILFHHRLQEQGDSYLLNSLIAFDSRERLDAFLDALQQIIDRHDILRTAVCWQGLAQPVQVVWRQAPMSVTNFVPASTDNVQAQLQAHTDPRHRRLDLSQAPLLTADIAHDPVNNDEWLLALGFHHLVGDHMTLELIINEISLLLQGQTDALPAPLPYRNFIAQNLSVPVSVHEDYFRAQLADVDAPTAPFGLLNAQSDGGDITEARLPLDHTLAQAIRDQARHLGISPGVLFHVAWAQVLAQTSGRDDVVFGSVLLGRLHGTAGADRVMGMFINTLPVRVSLANRSVLEVVQSTFRDLTILLEHEQAPLTLAQRCSGVTPPLPLFSTLFNYRHSQPNSANIDWNGIRLLTAEERTNYPLTLSVDDLGEGFNLVAQTITGIEPVRIANYLATALSSLIKALVTEPQRSILSLPVLPSAERQQLLVDFNATQADFPQETLIHELFEQQVERTPETTAVEFEGQSLSYRELNRRANQLAHHLLALGVQPDDRVAICTERSLEMVVGLLAILKAGAAYVPLDPAYPAERLAYMLADAAPVALLAQAAQMETLGSRLPVVVLDAPALSVWNNLPAENLDPRTLGLTSQHLAYVIYTSGSTGQPKGVMNSHRALCNRLVWMQETYGLTAHDRVLQKTPFSFDVSVWEFFWPLLFGARLVMARPEGHKEVDYLARLIDTAGITTLHFVPSMLQQFVQGINPQHTCASLKRVICSGEALSPELQQRFFARFNAGLHNLYGPTEAAIDVTYWACQPDDKRHFVPIGRPIANTQMYILDTQGQPVPMGVSGELHIGGVGVARGYLNRPELTAERFMADPFSNTPDARLYKTGDLGRWLPDGSIEYLGRNDFQVKLRGFRIELGEIEARLAQCSGVQESVVIAREDSPGDTRLVAYLRPQSGVVLAPSDLRQALAQHLAEYMLPGAFVMLETFPLTPNGKLDRKALPAPDQSAVVTRGYAVPVGELETTLAQIWQNLLGLERVGRYDHFFELGGHSLMVVSLIEQLRNAGWLLDVRTVFSAPVLTDMAQAIQANQGEPAFIVPPNRIPEGCTAITPEMLSLVTLSQAEIDTVVNTVAGGAANVQDIYPLAPLQEGILFHHRLQQQGDAYLLHHLIAFNTRERLDVFLKALQQVIDRHDILRTAVCWQGLTQPVQVVWRQAPLSVTTFVPASADNTFADNVSAQLQAHTDPRQRQIDLTQAPLCAAEIAHDSANNEWLLALSLHHLVCDHMTLGLIIAEIIQLLQEQAETLPIPLPYRNFIAQVLSVPASVHESYFRTRLADFDVPTAPFGLLNIQGDGEDVTEARLLLDTTLTQAIRTQARRLGINPGVLFHVAWAQMLAQTSGCDDVVFGTVLLGRLQGSAGADQVMGMFINTLPVRITLADCSVLEAVQATYNDLMALLEHEQAPLTLAQRCSGVNPPLPLFSALLNYRHSQPGTVDKVWDGMRILNEKIRTNYPLTLSVDDLGEDFSLLAQTVAGVDPLRLVNYLITAISGLVDALATEPQRPILSLPILPATERQQLLVDFNATQTDFPQEVLIHELFEQQVNRTPDATAVVFEGLSLTYNELNCRANRLAHYLLALGIQPDDRVAICVERSLEMVVGLLAILKAGGAYVPLDPAYPTERLAYMLDDVAPVALLTQSALVEILDSNLPTVVLDAQGLSVSQESTAFDKESEENLNVQTLGLTSRHLAYVIYTSGSTGQPKGVMVEHRSLCNLIDAQTRTLDITANSRLLQLASFSFDVCMQECCMALLTGACLYLAPRTHLLPGAELFHTLKENAITHMLLTPTALAALDSVPTTLRTLVVGGEVCSPALIKRLATGRRMFNAYGPTESTVCATLYLCNAQDEKVPPIGQPIANTQIYILDTQGQPVPLGVAGEIHIGGVGVARGYLNRPELTAERFIPDPFSTVPNARLYKTGDLGRWLPDGNIEYLDRNDFQVKLRGFRIELGEIEARLVQCPEIDEAVVIAREDTPGDKRLVAYLRTQPDIKLVPADLRQELAQHLADYMLPSAFVMLETFPLTPNGKLDRQALPVPDQSAVVTRGYEAPVGELETTLVQIWQDLLGLERIGRYDHFFELGGHSLMAVSLIEQLRSAGWLLDVRSVFSAPVLSDMAKTIRATQDESTFIVPPNRIPESCTAITPDMLPLVTLSQSEIDLVVETVVGGAANVQDIYPLAPLQEGILFHHRMQEQGDTYLLCSLMAFDTRERLDAFLNALQQVIDRHDILRTAAYWQGLSQPVQVVWKQTTLSVTPFVPASEDNVLAQLQAYTNPRQRRLDLSLAPLFAADIAYDPASHEWLLALSFHHLIGDHMTLALIVDEIQLLLQGRTEELPNSLPYRNFIAQTLSVPASVHEDYFRAQLADVDAPTAPFGLLNIQDDGEDIAEASLPLSLTLAQAIRSQARRLGISPGVLFHVAWAQVLAQTSGRDDVVFGSVLLGRLQGSVGADRVMGMFINTLPLRISLANRSVLEVVQDTYHDLITLLEHEQAPLTLAQRCSNVAPPMPLFSALLNYRHSQTSTTDTIWNGIRVLTTEDRTNYPLSLSVDDLGEGFNLTVQAIAGIDPTRVSAYLMTAIDGLVNSLATDPQRSVLSLPILPAQERQQLLVDFTDTETDFPRNILIHELFEQQAELTPDATAVVFEGLSLSYCELNHRANRLAHYLLTLGVQPDDRVAICVERSLEMIVGLLAILKAGGAYVPLDPAYPAERLAYMLEDAEPVALLTQSALSQTLNSSLPTVLLDTSVFSIYAENNPDAQTLGVTPHHLAYIIYTSGSTGQPKGVMVEHRNIVASTYARHLTYQHLERLLLLSSIAFDSSLASIFSTLTRGGCLCLPEQMNAVDPATILQALRRNDISCLLCVPSLALNLLQLATKDDMASLQTLIVAGERCLPELHARIEQLELPIALYNEYGPTETTVWASVYQVISHSQFNVPIGHPIANARIYILDTQGQPVPIGVAGEIYIGGAGVARGYLNRPEFTKDRFIPDPFSSVSGSRMYKTGDLGRWLPDGNIEYLGRNDFQVKLRGFRIELGEIEARLTQCLGVREAVVILREDIPGDKRLVAYLRPQPNFELVPTDLRQQLAQHLAEYMLPSAFVTLETFPLTPNGKLDRQAFPVPDQLAMATRVYEAPVGTMETILAQIWHDLLGLERVSRHDHFFELGGHSLMAVSLIERLRSAGWLLDVRSVFSTPVLAEMAQMIQMHQGKSAFNVPPNLISEDCTAITPELLPLVTLSQAEIDIIVNNVPGGAANVQDIYPLAPLQEGILFHHQLQEQGDTYLLRSMVAFDTRERLDAFLNALQKVIDRHDILRTAVCWQGLTQPVQVVWRHAPLPVNTFVPISEDNVPAQLHTYTDPRQRRLNLNRAPLFAADIAHDPISYEWLLALSFHHLVSDHMTLELIVSEITLLLQGQAKALPVALPYRDFIAQTLSVPESVHEDYFRTRLADIDAPTAPFGQLDVQGDGEGVTEAYLKLNITLAQAIRSQARRLGMSPGVLFHVAWAQVLAQTSGRDDVVFGSVLLGRLQGYSGADQVMGMFINTLPVRVSLADRSVLEVVQATYHDLTTLLEHEQAPLALAQRCSGVTPPMPLFSTLLNYRHSHSGAADDQVWSGMRMLAAEERTNYPLTLSVDDLGEDFSLVTQSVSGIDPTRLANYLITAVSGLVEALANEPQRFVLSLPILPAAERQQVLVDFNAPQADFRQEALIHELFEQQADLTPDAIAVVFEGQSLRYDELNRRANQLAHHLIALGVQPDDRVAICVERSLDMVVGLLGILKAGAAYLPLDPAYPTERLAYMLEDAAPVALLIQTALVEKVDSPLPTVVLDARSPRVFDREPGSNPDSRARGLTSRHLAYVIYTSGSTGQPKGVMVEHANAIRLLAATQGYFQFNSNDVWTLFHSFAFDFSVWEIWGALSYGGKLVIVPAVCARSPQAFYALLCQERVTVLNQTPSAFRQLIPAQDDTAHSLRCIIFGGEALDLPMLAPWIAHNPVQQTRLVNMYGITEITVHATYRELTGEDITEGRGSLIGQPLPDLRAYLLDHHGQPVPIGVTGELYIGGAGVARGYLNRPALTAERFMADPFSTAPDARLYKTGDLGRWLPDGSIEYLGRNDFQVKIRGFRIELGEIEARLVQCTGVQEAVVIAREDIAGDIRLVAYLRPQSGVELVPADLRQELAQHLAEYMLPGAFVMIDTFPLTANGKLDRKALPAPDQLAMVSRGYEPPQGEVETMLAQIWQELLGLERVGRHDHFFELGGHSLLAVQLLNCVSQQGMEISLATLFSHPTLYDLALAISDSNDSSNSSDVSIKPSSPFDANPVPLSPSGSLPPLFLVHETTGDPLAYSLLATLLPSELPVYGLQALGFHTIENPPTSIEELAACHIQAIRRVQPHGPYYLAGWSIGGVIVYEMALQLINSGEEVKYLGMIDSYNLSGLKIDTASGYSHELDIDVNKSINNTQKDIDMIINYLRDHMDIVDEPDFDKLYHIKDLNEVLAFCEERQWLPMGITKEDVLLRIDTQRTILQFGRSYIAPASSLPIYLYTADKLPSGYDSWRGWRDIVGEHSVLHPIGGTHSTIMQQPLINQLVDSITEHLLPTSYAPGVIIQKGTASIPPLFCIPGAGASASSFIALALSLPSQLPVHALQSRGLIESHLPPYISVEGTAHAYVQAIRQMQPHGPYHLLGHSFGGWIAFEIALQLQAQGERVTDLILVDSRAPDLQDSVPKAVGRVETFMKLIDIYNMMLTQPLPFTRQDFENQESDEQIQLLLRTLVNVGIFPAHASMSLLQGIVQVMQANLNTNYTPSARYEGLAHLINAKEGDVDETENRKNMWSKHVTQLNTMIVSGNHMTMLSNPQVKQFATWLWEELDYVNNPNLERHFMK